MSDTLKKDGLTLWEQESTTYVSNTYVSAVRSHSGDTGDSSGPESTYRLYAYCVRLSVFLSVRHNWGDQVSIPDCAPRCRVCVVGKHELLGLELVACRSRIATPRTLAFS